MVKVSGWWLAALAVGWIGTLADDVVQRGRLADARAALDAARAMEPAHTRVRPRVVTRTVQSRATGGADTGDRSVSSGAGRAPPGAGDATLMLEPGSPELEALVEARVEARLEERHEARVEERRIQIRDTVEDYAQRAGVDDETADELHSSVEGGMAEVDALFSAERAGELDRDDVWTSMGEVRDQTREELTAVLGADEAEALMEALGPPFSTPPEGGPPGGGPPGGAPPGPPPGL